MANGTARQSAMVANTNGRFDAFIWGTITSGAAAPTAGNVYEIYAIRGNTAGTGATYRTDAAGTGDAAIVIENAPLITTTVVTATTNKQFAVEGYVQNIGPEFGIAVKNSSGGTLNPTSGSHVLMYTFTTPEVQ